MNLKRLLPITVTGAALVLSSAACKKPEPAPPPAVKTDDAEARARAEAEARRKAEEEARRKREEQEKAEKARLAEAEMQRKAYQNSAAAALQDIHFDFDESEIKPEWKAGLQRIADFLRTYPKANLRIEGHCDERGTVEYNIALGDRRAYAAKDYLAALGIAKERLSTVSYGKEQPVCTEATEACWSRNRRAHFRLQD